MIKKRAGRCGGILIGIILICSSLFFSGCTKQKNHKDSTEKTSNVTVKKSVDSNLLEGEGILYEINEDNMEASVGGYSEAIMGKVTIPDRITFEKREYTVTKIGEEAFESNQIVKELVMGKNVTEISNYAFYACPFLEKLKLSDNVQIIGEEAFAECTSIENISWNQKIRVLGKNAFRACESLKTVTVPKSITDIGAGIFTDCISLHKCEIEKGISILGEGMFTNCSSLQDVVLPDTIFMIGQESFWGCTELKVLDIPSSVKSIGDRAFYGTSIQVLKFPQGISGVKMELLEGMEQLDKIIIAGSDEKVYSEIFAEFGIEIEIY